ncbi:Esterase/lipase [Xaviernesmea oryzae]|uniref:Esterase/lipase n=1 Tax=Xaviernesmea oryzae TaxID=464029 RepID=A0A1X7E0N2_9HYPH|nr:Esterase/lipase [Xaviernesmea oryzae]
MALSLAEGDLTAENEAALRQFTLQRLLGYGLEFGDANALRDLVAGGADWHNAALALADQRLALLEERRSSPTSRHTRRDVHYRASALLRASQVMMTTDTEYRREIYDRAAREFSLAILDDEGRERVVLDGENGRIAGWYFSAGAGVTPVVIIVGGVEGWAMDAEPYGRVFAERGISVLLIDAPGQGESRFQFSTYISREWKRAMLPVIEYAHVRARGAPVGLLGNSVGGNFACHLAADPRVAACCNNGALLDPIKQRERKSFFLKMIAATGGLEGFALEEAWSTLEMTPESMNFTCPLLIVQGGEDPLVSVAESKLMLDWSKSPDKQMYVFEEGDHCIYRRPADKYNLIGDWFQERLLRE